MIDENFVRFIVIPDTQYDRSSVVLDVVGCCNEGTICAADAIAFLFLNNNKKGEKLILSFLCTMSKED